MTIEKNTVENNNLKNYEEATLKVVRFDKDTVIATSYDDECGDSSCCYIY